MQFAHNKTAHVNGDLGHSPTSGSGPVVPQVKQLWFRKPQFWVLFTNLILFLHDFQRKTTDLLWFSIFIVFSAEKVPFYIYKK